MSGHEGDQTVWKENFSDRVRGEQREDDSTAWWIVTGLLIFIVSIGLCLGTLAVWLCA